MVQHEADIQSKMEQINEFQNTMLKLTTKVNKCVDTCPLNYQNKQRLAVVRRCLTALVSEKLISMKMDELADFLNYVHGSEDVAFGGLWLHTQSENSQKFFDTIGTSVIPTTRKYKFDAATTDHLIHLTFSLEDEVRAKAKLALSSKLADPVHKAVMRDPDHVLQIVFAESCLTPNEILGMLFQQTKSCSDRVCVRCKTTITPSRRTYHTKCKVVEWLVSRSHFIYDEVEKAFQIQQRSWITPKQTHG
jgi:hypothetical protein